MFSLTEDQIAIRDMAQGFAAETLAPEHVGEKPPGPAHTH